MFIVIDESGNEGFPLTNGQSKWFCLVAVIFSRDIHSSIEQALAGLYESFGAKEFHFRDDNATRKQGAIDVMSTLDFTFHAVTCDKSQLQQRGWRPPRPKKAKPILSEMAVTLVNCLVIPGDLDKLDVLFDTLGGPKADNAFKVELRRLLRKKTGNNDLKIEIESRNSSKTPCIQLADYVCGALMRSIRADRSGYVCGALMRSIRADRSGIDYYQRFKSQEASLTQWA